MFVTCETASIKLRKRISLFKIQAATHNYVCKHCLERDCWKETVGKICWKEIVGKRLMERVCWKEIVGKVYWKETARN